jgi:hypothetical protein
MPDDVAGKEVLAIPVRHQQLHRRMCLDTIVDAAQKMVEPRRGLGDAAVGSQGCPVVSTGDQQVGAIVAELLEGLERAARLDVEEAVDHQDRQVVRVAAEPAFLPEGVERRVEQAAVQPAGEQSGDDVEGRSRIPLQALRALGECRSADQQDDAGARDDVGNAAGHQQVAVELERAGLQDGRPDTRKLLVQGVVDDDGAG